MNVYSSLKKGTELKQAVQATGGMSLTVTQSAPPKASCGLGHRIYLNVI